MIDVVVGLFEEGSHMVIVHHIVDNVPFAWCQTVAQIIDKPGQQPFSPP